MGSGSFGYVFKHHSGYIVKIVRDGDSCYYNFVEYCLKNRNNPHLPKFKTKILKQFDEKMYMVRMEELQRLDSTELSNVRILINAALNRKHNIIKINDDFDANGFPKIFNHADSYKTFYETLLDLNNNRNKNCWDDLEYSNSNVMKREDNVFVIIDPWYTST